MPTLLLSSNGSFAISKISEIVGKDSQEIKLAYVTTAGLGVDNKDYIASHKEQMSRLGINFEEITELKNKSREELEEFLNDKDAVYVEGGNTYYLLKEIKASGLDEILKQKILQGAVYIGVSAGSYIICPTIEMSNWKPKELRKDDYGLKDFNALNLVPFLIKAHYQQEDKDWIKRGAKQAGYPVKILKDGQALLIKDGKVELVGEGEEVKI